MSASMGIRDLFLSFSAPDQDDLLKSGYYLHTVTTMITEYGLEGVIPPDPPEQLDYGKFTKCFRFFTNIVCRDCKGADNPFWEGYGADRVAKRLLPMFEKRQFMNAQDWRYATEFYGWFADRYQLGDISDHTWQFRSNEDDFGYLPDEEAEGLCQIADMLGPVGDLLVRGPNPPIPEGIEPVTLGGDYAVSIGKCSDCGATVQLNAERCPGCGRIFRHWK
jgi:hypothetical protein